MTTVAEVTVTPTLVSDYDYRGISQTANEPAIQVGADYTGEHLHLEVWSSNVKFVMSPGFFDSRHSEIVYSVDAFTGDDALFKYDLGINYLTYPGWHANIDYSEVWGTVSHRSLSLSLHYSWNYSNSHPPRAASYGESRHIMQVFWHDLSPYRAKTIGANEVNNT